MAITVTGQALYIPTVSALDLKFTSDARQQELHLLSTSLQSCFIYFYIFFYYETKTPKESVYTQNMTRKAEIMCQRIVFFFMFFWAN